MRLRTSLVVCALFTATAARAAAETAAEAAVEERPVTGSATAYLYLVPGAPNFVMVVAPVDIRRVHVEARYNYEALDSGAGFIGFNVGWGERLKLRVTPMLGAVVGDLDGWVPALRWTLACWKLDVYSESEVVIDLAETGDSFFYNWTELGIAPLPWLRAGIALQRSRIFHTPLDIQRGLFVSATFRFATASIYEFNAFWTTPTWVVALGVSF
jgi:hypothetical protein